MSSGLQSDREQDPVRPYCTGSIAPIPFVHSSCPEDFRVEELPEGEPGAGQEDWTHLWFEIEKRGLSTAQAVGRVARALGREPREVGYAGRKDTMGVTRQFLSLEHVDATAVQGLELKDLRVLATGRRPRKLRVGELAGNRFDLTLREFPPERHEDLERALSQLTREGLPNFYGPQRFGAGGTTLRMGSLLVGGDWRAYLRAFVHSHHGPGEVQESSPVASLLVALDSDQRKDWRAARSLTGELPTSLVPLAKQMARRPLDLESLVRTLPRRTKALHISALQAAVFNRVLDRRMVQPGGAGRVLPGDLLVDPWTGEGEPAPEGDAAAEAQIQADLLQRVPSGPLPGPAAQRTRGAVAEWEGEALRQAGLELEALASLPGGLAPKGARRALLVGPRDLTWEAEGTVVRLRFTLPPGSYATVLLEELGKSRILSQ